MALRTSLSVIYCLMLSSLVGRGVKSACLEKILSSGRRQVAALMKGTRILANGYLSAQESQAMGRMTVIQLVRMIVLGGPLDHHSLSQTETCLYMLLETMEAVRALECQIQRIQWN